VIRPQIEARQAADNELQFRTSPTFARNSLGEKPRYSVLAVNASHRIPIQFEMGRILMSASTSNDLLRQRILTQTPGVLTETFGGAAAASMSVPLLHRVALLGLRTSSAAGRRSNRADALQDPTTAIRMRILIAGHILPGCGCPSQSMWFRGGRLRRPGGLLDKGTVGPGAGRTDSSVGRPRSAFPSCSFAVSQPLATPIAGLGTSHCSHRPKRPSWLVFASAGFRVDFVGPARRWLIS